MSNVFHLCYKAISVLIVFVFILAIHDWYVDNQYRYAIVEDTLVILRILMGVQFAVGIKIVSDAIVERYRLSVEWTFTALSVLVVITLPLLAIAAAFARRMFMD